ncbi:MAG TPA: hypothetical protein VFE51_02895 [Verrucomicrobiae bacterium]|nr:hypothetical protein [Verrucomicrobiae bacterium]
MGTHSSNKRVGFRYEGMWVFDDARVGLDKEPFVSGADTMIDVLVSDIPNAEKGFRLLFSATPFPGYKVKPSHGCRFAGSNPEAWNSHAGPWS